MIRYSLIVPVYNIKKEYIDDCISSLVAQTFENFEIIIVDDGSDNGCSAWCDEWVEKSDKIRTIHQKNAGVSTARNTGIINSGGEYVIFVDPDDWVDTDMLEKIEQVRLKNDFDILIHSFSYEYINSSINENNDPVGTIKILSEIQKREMLKNLIDVEKKTEYHAYKGKIFGSVWAKCYKKEFILSHRIAFQKNLKKAQDTVFNLWAINAAEKIIVYNVPLYRYRMVKSSVTHRYNSNIIKIQVLFLKAVKKFIDQNGYSDYMAEAFSHRCILSYFSMMELDVFNENNNTPLCSRYSRWLKVAKSGYIKAITFDSIKKYSVKSKLVLFMTKFRCFSALTVLFTLKNKLSAHKDTTELYE